MVEIGKPLKIIQQRSEDLSSRITQITQQCPYCGSSELVHDFERGEIVCPRCGSVIQEHVLDLGQEWRTFSADDRLRRERTSPINVVAPNQGLGTDEIDVSKLQGRDTRRLRLLERIKKINETIRRSSTIEKNLGIIMNYVKQIQTSLNLPAIVLQEVAIMYRQLAKYNLKGLWLKELAAALVYLACKKQKIVCRLKELQKVADIDRRRLGKVLKKIKEVIKYARVISVTDEEVKKYAIKILNKLNIPEHDRITILRLVLDILRHSKDIHLTNGRCIHSIIASAIYIATTMFNIKKRQKDVAEAADVTDVTIRTRYKEILEKLDIIVYV